MSTKTKVHNLIILDESGSMNSIREEIINGFNALMDNISAVEKQFPDQEHFVSFYTFNGLGIKKLYFMAPVAAMQPISKSNYQPNNNTPLYDAIGEGVTSLRKSIEGDENCRALVTIMTDGYENCSKEYSGSQIKALINELKKQQWTFAYVGADHDVEKVAFDLSISGKMMFEKSKVGIDRWMVHEREARMCYSLNIRDGAHQQEDFYKLPDKEQKKK